MSSVADPRPAPRQGSVAACQRADEVRRPPRSSPPTGPPPRPARKGTPRVRPAAAKTAATTTVASRPGLVSALSALERLSSGVCPPPFHDPARPPGGPGRPTSRGPGRRTRRVPAGRGGAPVRLRASATKLAPPGRDPEQDIGESGPRRSRSLRQQQASSAGDRGHQQPHGQKRCAPPTCASERDPASGAPTQTPVAAVASPSPSATRTAVLVGGPGHGGPGVGLASRSRDRHRRPRTCAPSHADPG